jgi:choline dehydrogenase-like flavoprotein
MIKTYDYIIVGGGSAGCVLASRLTENPSVRVCLIEPGGKGSSTLINTPAAQIAMLPTRLNNWALQSTPQAGLNGRNSYQPRGKALGGSSAINAMVYVRGHARDYERWVLQGNSGWSYADVLPYFRRSERNERGACLFHGDTGPLHVSEQRSHNEFNQIFLQAAQQAGYAINEDFNGADQDGFGTYQVTQHEGKRYSAAHAFLSDSVRRRSNLTIELNAQVHKILIAGRIAYGVQVEQDRSISQYVAHKEVILCAGALHTPQLLMLSGIGSKAHLHQHEIDCVLDLPGVGQNLHDHVDFVFGYRLHDTRLVGASRASFAIWLRAMRQYLLQGEGMLASNYAESGGFLRTKPDLPQPDIQTIFVPALVEDHARKLHWGHGYTCHTILLQPRSRGSVTLASKSILTPPRIDPNYLYDLRDIDTLVAGYKAVSRILQAPSLSKLGAEDCFTQNVKTDADIVRAIRSRADTAYNPVGTCRMGRDSMAVVNTRLQVHGIRCLRVVDASVMPTIVSGNTHAPTVMIAEKAYDMIQRDSMQSN